MIRRSLALGAMVYALSAPGHAQAPACPAASPPAAPQPAPARAAGYDRLTFATISSFTPQTVDLRRSGAAGFQWYLESPAVALGADGSATVGYGGTNAALASAAFSGKSWRGFAVGGGAYLEATLAFDAAAVDANRGWPSWWTYAWEKNRAQASGDPAFDQWQGQAHGYEHFIEPDIMEKMDTGPASYLGATHEHYGVYGQTCGRGAGGYCDYQAPWSAEQRRLPAPVDFSQYHRYGLLWIPATATRRGSLTYFFDGQQVGPAITWTQFQGQPPVSPTMAVGSGSSTASTSSSSSERARRPRCT
jgi:hypothetical protein